MARKGGRRPTFKEITEQLKAKASQPPTKPYNVSLTETARDVYLELEEWSRKAEENRDPTNQHCTTFRMVDDAIHRIIPADPLNPKYALHEPLADMFRISKGRLRILWVVEPALREISIVYISDTLRKEEDSKDPYAILDAMAKAGYLSTVIEAWRKALEVPPGAPVN